MNNIQLELFNQKVNDLFGKRHSNCTLDNYVAKTKEQKKIIHFCKEYVKLVKKGHSIVFSGNPGTGKDHLAIAIAREILMMNYNTKITCIDFNVLCEKKRVWQQQTKIWTDMMLKQIKADLLIITEFGLRELTDSHKEVLDYVIDYCYRNYQSFIITTNLTPDDLKKQIDLKYSRIYDRLKEVCKIKLCQWESFRVNNNIYDNIEYERKEKNVDSVYMDTNEMSNKLKELQKDLIKSKRFCNAKAETN